MSTADRKHDVALFADNVELCDITENLVFDDPYFAAEMNRHTSPQLDSIIAQLRADIDLKVEVQHLKARFCTNAETLLHGDLHTGSVMVHERSSFIIDPEFAVYGPIGFDIGMLLANFFMAFFAQSGHGLDLQEYQHLLLSVIEDIWSSFSDEFSRLWREERTGILYQQRLFEDQGHTIAAEQALLHRLDEIWQDTIGFAGVEMHRRTLGLAHIIEMDNIEDPDLRAACEKRSLLLGRQCIVNRQQFRTVAQLTELAHRIENGHIA
jgi:5-methylthioribose kinase